MNNFSIAYICYCRNVFTKCCQAALRDTYTDTQTGGGIYEVRRRDGPKLHDIHTRFLKNWFRNLKVNAGGLHMQIHSKQQCVIVSVI